MVAGATAGAATSGPRPDRLRPAAGEAEAELKDFSPYYRRQFSIARFLQVEDDLEQRKEKVAQLLMQKVPPPPDEPRPV